MDYSQTTDASHTPVGLLDTQEQDSDNAVNVRTCVL